MSHMVMLMLRVYGGETVIDYSMYRKRLEMKWTASTREALYDGSVLLWNKQLEATASILNESHMVGEVCPPNLTKQDVCFYLYTKINMLDKMVTEERHSSYLALK
ncbi:hypothetical protein Hamer_G004970 [Homarus americanus]|uniref:Uncharacterized protein n=1 Tax=Homarus americanus TaxID=6706 RepID=A0A8J5MV82_HOMAM|nr:hypothetical protein Hamer_G004970 [Homarus americanus]